MLEVQSARLDDLPQLCELLEELFALEAEFKPDPEKQSRALRHILEHPEVGHILVLREENKIVGMVSLLATVSTACGGPALILEDMIVRKEQRSRGAGSLLLGNAMAYARNHGFVRITLLTDRDTSAVGFYEKHGFTLSHMVPMRLHL
ncbi:MAG: GNAT family N-acetyltransferase [Blastochloris sp.]|nr:GNAT family N-acetyltransferase [Blastochloris sp.]